MPRVQYPPGRLLDCLALFLDWIVGFISPLGSNELYGTIYKLRTVGLGSQYNKVLENRQYVIHTIDII